MAAKSDGLLKMKSSDVAFTPLQNSDHSGSVQGLAAALQAGSAGGGGGGETGCSDGGSRCCGGGGGGGGGGASPSPLCLRLGREQQRRRQRRYSLCDCLWILAAVAVYFADVGTDVWLAVDYYTRGQHWWFGLTLFFAALGSLSVQVFSFRWFVHDFSTEDSGPCPQHQQQQQQPLPPHHAAASGEGKPGSGSAAAAAGEGDVRPATPHRQASSAGKSGTGAAGGRAAKPAGQSSGSCAFCVWLLQSLIHILQLGQIWRYFRTIYLGIRSRQSAEHDRWRFYWKMVYEYADVSMLHLLATFLESAPQLVLQLCIVVQTHSLQALQGQE
ncbi:XK-related protein 4-like [Rhinatrema bivittatum]|uniref:XK-related protein 4-like n=1 Tax=Rhinatrema bivittatum TaxID=194408 RepID=UPI001127DA70|nr:XK-related protein 4-like [Rhinatrema bivittatum]